MKKRKWLYVFLTIFLLCIAIPIIYKPNNIGFDLTNVIIKKEDKFVKLQDVVNSHNKKFIFFFSYECPYCKDYKNDKSIKDNFLFINVDYNKSIPKNDIQMIEKQGFDIFYIPYIVEIDSTYKIVKEYKLYEIEEKFKRF